MTMRAKGTPQAPFVRQPPGPERKDPLAHADADIRIAPRRIAQGTGPPRPRRFRHPDFRRAYERICRLLCPAPQMADRLRRQRRKRGGAQGPRRRQGRRDVHRWPLHGAGPRAGRRQALRLRGRSGHLARQVDRRARAGGSEDRLRRLAPRDRMGRGRREGLRQEGHRAGPGRGQSDRRDLGRPPRGLEGRSRAAWRRPCRPVERREARRSGRLAQARGLRRHGRQRTRFGRLAAQHARHGRRQHAGGAVLCPGACRRHGGAVHRAREGDARSGQASRQCGDGAGSRPSSSPRWHR